MTTFYLIECLMSKSFSYDKLKIKKLPRLVHPSDVVYPQITTVKFHFLFWYLAFLLFTLLPEHLHGAIHIPNP